MGLKVEVLLSCMHQEDFSIIDKCKIRTDALVINQHTNNDYTEINIAGRKVRMFSSTQRGLSKSRNYALSQAEGDICILCDDDVTYVDDYESIVIDAFHKLPQADVIVFNTSRINAIGQRNPITKIKKAPKFKSYGSVRIAFRLNSIRRANVWFNVNFGAGGTYSLGEESLWLNGVRRKGLKIYEHPATICTVDYGQSTWFTGRHEKYYYDKGAFLAACYPFAKAIFKYYYVCRLYDKTELTKSEILSWIERGINGYKHSLSFREFISHYKTC